MRSLALLLTLLLESEEPSESSLTSRVAKLPLKELRMLLIMEELVSKGPVVPMTKLVKTLMVKKDSMDAWNTALPYP